jgi:hypothetical protein
MFVAEPLIKNIKLRRSGIDVAPTGLFIFYDRSMNMPLLMELTNAARI